MGGAALCKPAQMHSGSTNTSYSKDALMKSLIVVIEKKTGGILNDTGGSHRVGKPAVVPFIDCM